MRPELREEVQGWLTRADRDLLAAENLLQDAVIVGEAVTYHSQQAAEKALKGFLTARGIVFKLTHDVTRLVVQCQAVDAEFGGFADTAEVLTPYAVRFRYPGGPIGPSLSEAQRALQLATEIVQFVHRQLPVEPPL